MEPVDPALIEQKARILTILCGALLSSLVIYVVVGFTVAGSGRPVATGVPVVAPWVLAAAAVLALAAGETVSRTIFAQRSAGVTSPSARLEAYQQATIVGFGVREWAGILGLVATLLTGSLAWCVGLCAATALTMFAAWPRRERLAAIAADAPPPIG